MQPVGLRCWIRDLPQLGDRDEVEVFSRGVLHAGRLAADHARRQVLNSFATLIVIAGVTGCYSSFHLMKTHPNFDLKDGVVFTSLKAWDDFHSFVKQLLDLPAWVFRGQKSPSWDLEPSIARILSSNSKAESLMAHHLEKFKLTSRGRRGANPPVLLSDDDWWALGQHHGLATPLLDWTSSPYVALFFALCEPALDNDPAHCVIFGINRTRIEQKVNELVPNSPDEAVYFFQPKSDENSRLVAQSGLFSRGPIQVGLEKWVRKHFKGENSRGVLFKLRVPNNERLETLKALNVMNINHATLFPDLYGAGKHCTEILRRYLTTKQEVTY